MKRRLIERLANLQSARHVKAILAAQHDARVWLDSRYATNKSARGNRMIASLMAARLQSLLTNHRRPGMPAWSRLLISRAGRHSGWSCFSYLRTVRSRPLADGFPLLGLCSLPLGSRAFSCVSAFHAAARTIFLVPLGAYECVH